ncbi:MAG: HupE/UreJ family protein [Deferrisomatales bacterium]
MRRVLLVATALAVASQAFGHGMSEADKQAMLAGGYVEYLWLGARHMLTGYDHLLFIFGAIFFLTRFRDVVRTITAFTLGHSITLVFATLLGVTANYYLVDAVIALSVCYKGFENLDGFRRYWNWEPPNLAGVIFAFGLVHGFGLSTRLQQLPLGDDRTGLVLRILSFNVGVEVGQVAALAAMVVLLAGWRGRPSFRRFSAAANGCLVAAGLLLFLMQLHGYSHTVYPDDLGFSQDLHRHDHEAIEVEKAKQRIPGNLLGGD